MGLAEILFIVSTLSHFQYQGFKGDVRYMGEPERPLKFMSFISHLLRLFFFPITHHPHKLSCSLQRRMHITEVIFRTPLCAVLAVQSTRESTQTHTDFPGAFALSSQPFTEGLGSFLQAPGEPHERFKPVHIFSRLSSEFKLNIYRAQQDLH